ncbi:uncharacterized protein VTP21DRAFT_7898 [Calcarisporiella thermophila]|uniref:uncharacterized protein n=1 Tax=Calcarisporiella thermophila TaxID=911321 RepID=UPI003742BA37
MSMTYDNQELVNLLLQRFEKLSSQVEKLAGTISNFTQQQQNTRDTPFTSNEKPCSGNEKNNNAQNALVLRSKSNVAAPSAVATEAEQKSTTVATGPLYGIFLSSATDLHLLMVQNFGSDYASFVKLTPKEHPKATYQIPIKGVVTRRLLLIEAPEDNSVVVGETTPTFTSSVVRHPLLHQLFSTYLSPCFFFLQPVNRKELMDLFLADKLEPAFLYSAVAWAALHIYQSHKDPPLGDQLPALAHSAYLEAQQHLREVFDEPSEQTVMASFNLGIYHLLNSRTNEFYIQIGHAIGMARQMGIYIDDVSESDPLKREAKRRIWWALYTHDCGLSVYSTKVQTLLFPQANKIVRPKCLPGESQDTQYCLDYVISIAELLTCLKRLPEIDWNASDEDVMATVMEIVENMRPFIRALDFELPLFGEDTDEIKQRISKLSWVELAYPPHFWSSWGQVWFRFLEESEGALWPTPPPNRMNTPKMKALRSLALNECAKAASWITILLEETARRHDWCHTLPISATLASCRMHRYIALNHPDELKRRRSLHYLAVTFRVVQSKPICQWLQARRLQRWLRATLLEMRRKCE